MPQSKAALGKLTVLDLSTMVAGPYCASILGEFGAEVIKVEIPGKGDTCRNFGTPTEAGSSLVWLSEARNKKSVTLDLRQAKGLALFKRLVEQADVVVENFRPGTLEKWGAGYEELSRINPRLIMVRISAYGQTGPYRDRPGFARIAHAFSGLAYLAGEQGRTPVVPGSTSLADYVSGLYGAMGALIALQSRNESGAGQVVDVGLYEGIFRMLDEMPAAFARSGFVRERQGPDTVNTVAHSHYRAGDGKWFALACTTDRMWERLMAALGRDALITDPAYSTIAERLKRRDEINSMITEFAAARSRDETVDHFVRFDVPAGPINSIADIFEDPQFAARENMVRMQHPDAGPVVVANVLPRLSATPGELRWLGPKLGEHNLEILQQRLGVDAATMAELAAERVI